MDRPLHLDLLGPDAIRSISVRDRGEAVRLVKLFLLRFLARGDDGPAVGYASPHIVRPKMSNDFLRQFVIGMQLFARNDTFF
jgi:hypothetical protein